MPTAITELNPVSKFFGDVGLPVYCGSIDVVHVKWSSCPAGGFNHAKGKETFPSLGFQCITNFNGKILTIYVPRFGSRMDIVKMDDNVLMMTAKRLFRDAKWKCYNQYSRVRSSQRMYLICDNGYFHWPTTICPFIRMDTTTPEGFFLPISRMFARMWNVHLEY